MKRTVVLVAAASIALASCGSDSPSTDTPAPDTTVAATSAPSEDVQIVGAWARTSAAGQTTGAIYFDLTVSENDRLVSVSVPVSVAARAEIHEVVPAEGMDDDMTETTMAMGDDDMTEGTTAMGDDDMPDMGAMVMQQLENGLALQAGETVRLMPGGYHVMLIDIAKPLVVGDQIELTLQFENAGTKTLTVEVAESAP